MEGVQLGGNGLWDPQVIREWPKEGCSGCSIAALGVRLEDWIWGTERFILCVCLFFKQPRN